LLNGKAVASLAGMTTELDPGVPGESSSLLGLDEIVSLSDVEALAEQQLSAPLLAYYQGGAGDEHTLRENRTAFDRYRLLPRIGEGGLVSTATTLLGTEVSMPVGIAPSAAHGLACAEGEVATAGAGRQARAMYCASSSSSRPVEEISAAAGGADGDGAWWYQCYPASGAAGLGRAAELGYKALVLTADVPVAGHRDREFRGQRAYPGDPLYRGTWVYTHPGADLSANMTRTRVTWPDIRKITAAADVPVVIKGILTGDDAARAVQAGAAAVWVSNHGARQLDRAPATISVLAEVVDAVGGAAEVYVDGGFRRGTDIAIALALGARAVFVGRPVVMGLAAGGEHGATVVLEQLRKELVNTMYMLGVNTPGELGRRCVAPGPGY
jgi:isopentenyl diphosphate isomerase/L-lactate dehydrogenase-like FMN-dependent dehydrogenase